MKYRVALEELNHELTSYRTEMESWARAKAVAADKIEDQHNTALKDLRENISAVEERKATSELEVAQLHERLSRERAELDILQRDLKEAQAQHDSLPEEIQHFKLDLDTETTALQRQEKALADKESLRESKLRSLRQALDLYRARLGLKFCRERQDGELLLVFTHIDPQNHHREFKLGVRVHDDNTYSISRCEPQLDQQQLNSMLEELNRTSSFSLFVRELRRQFQSLAMSGN